MKKSTSFIAVIFTIILTTLVVGTQPALAQDDGMNKLINQVQRSENQAAKDTQKQQRQEQNLDNLKKRADKMIDNRIDALNKVLQRIQNDKRLSADEKSSLSAEIQTNISGLTSLKAKIDADTDITVARTDSKSIITNFRVFAIFEPKIRLLVTIDNMSASQTRLSSLTPKLQNLINNLKSQGKDVSKLQPLLDDINSNLSTIGSKLSADRQTVLGISASSNPSTFASVRQDLATVREEFAKVRSDIGQMRVEFQTAIKSNVNQPTTSSPSPSPTVTP